MGAAGKQEGKSAKRRGDRTSLAVIWVLTALFAVLGPSAISGLALVENWAGDARRVLLAEPRPQHAGIVLLTITEETLAQLDYRSPVDRGFLARLLDHLGAAGAGTVALDILFDGPTEALKDEALKAAIGRFPGSVVLSLADRTDGLTEAQARYLGEFVSGRQAGYVNLVKDDVDGVVRHIYPGRGAGDAFRPGFAGAIVKAQGQPPPGQAVPLAYRQGPDAETPAFRTFAAHTALFLPPDWLKGKIVIIGADLPLDDRHRTPFATVYGSAAGSLPGVAIHAHAVSQLLENAPGPGASGAGELFLAAAVTALGLGLALLTAGLAVKTLLALAAVAALWGGGFALFAATGVLMPLLAPSLACGASFALAQAVLWRRANREREFIGQAFGHYVSPGVIAALEENPESLSLTGERREISLIFTDIEGFTQLTEKTPPDVLVPLLNEYLAGMGDIVLGHEGTIDKYIGDAVMALFGAPVAQPDHAARAIDCALALDRFAQDFMTRSRLRKINIGQTRIGVHSGTVTVGNFGGEARFDYTAVGDAVNVAARLEGANKKLGTRICLSAEAVDRSGFTAAWPVGDLLLQGKDEPVRAYTPVSPARPPEQTELYMKGYQCLEAGDAAAALAAFFKLAAQCPDDNLVAMHLERLGNGETGVLLRAGGK